jgi:hypothetical protein
MREETKIMSAHGDGPGGIRIRLIFLAVHFAMTGQNIWRASRLS